MTSLPDLFPGFREHWAERDGVRLFARVASAGPPLLLLHGYPQTHVCWHRIAPALGRSFTVVVADLRGYGQSSAPHAVDNPATYSKREMALDCIALMRSLGHSSFLVAGHDRGGRVAYRLALDHPEVVQRLAVLDILPTGAVWERMGAASALASYHWTFLAQPFPMPETLIGGAPDLYCDHTLASWTKGRSLAAFAPEALQHYRAQMTDPIRVHAMCSDYRAGATVDREADDADRAAGRRIACPTLALWGSSYVGRGSVDPLDVWRRWCADVRGAEIDAGHFLIEEQPELSLVQLQPFLLGG